MFFIYSKDLFLLNKQVEKIVRNYRNENSEIEVNTYSWIEDIDQKIGEDIESTSFFVDKKIIIIKDCYFLTEKKKDSSWANNDSQLILKLLEKPNLENLVIFTLNEPKISQKLKLTKKFQENVEMIELKELDNNRIVKFIQAKVAKKNKDINLQDIQYFIDKLPNDMMVINNELEKLLNLEIKTIDKTVIDQNIASYFESDAYKLSEYFQTNNIQSFLKEFRNYSSLSTDLVRLIYLLNTNTTFTRDCLILKRANKSEAEISNLLNSHPYRVKMALKNNNLNIKQLNDKILVLYKVNKMIITGSNDPLISTELELIKNMSRS